MTQLDGSVLAGPLAELLGHDLTASEGRCAGCGRVAPLGEADVYLTAMGTVVRCRGCGGVLAVLVVAGAEARLAMPGLRGLAFPRD